MLAAEAHGLAERTASQRNKQLNLVLYSNRTTMIYYPSSPTFYRSPNVYTSKAIMSAPPRGSTNHPTKSTHQTQQTKDHSDYLQAIDLTSWISTTVVSSPPLHRLEAPHLRSTTTQPQHNTFGDAGPSNNKNNNNNNSLDLALNVTSIIDQAYALGYTPHRNSILSGENSLENVAEAIQTSYLRKLAMQQEKQESDCELERRRHRTRKQSKPYDNMITKFKWNSNRDRASPPPPSGSSINNYHEQQHQQR